MFTIPTEYMTILRESNYEMLLGILNVVRTYLMQLWNSPGLPSL